MLFETSRLMFREMVQEDFADLAEMLKDPDVVAIYEQEFTSQDVQLWLDRQLERYRKDGCGLWAAIWKETGEMVGQAGIIRQPWENGTILEAAYLLKKRFWHHGFAREAAMGCIQYAFDTMGADAVYSMIRKDNPASIRVAQAAGMQAEQEFLRQCYASVAPHFLYCIRKEAAIKTSGAG